MQWLAPPCEDALLDYACKLTPPTRCRNVSKSEHLGKTSFAKICQCSATNVVALAIEKATALNQIWYWKTRTCQERTSVVTQGSKSLCKITLLGKRYKPDGPIHVATNLTPLNVANPSHAMTPQRIPKLIAPIHLKSRCCKTMQLGRCACIASTR